MKANVIGLGGMGKRYLQILKAMKIEVAGVCDARRHILDSVVAEYGLTSAIACTEPEVLFRSSAVDLAIIATTATVHCYLTCTAAECGADYILCEKPMATSLQDCDRMLDACRRFNAHLAVNHQMRFMPQYTEPKRVCESEVIGGLCSISVVGGNIGIAMNGTHYIEMFRYMTDESPMSVTAWLSDERVTNPRGDEFEDKGGCIRVETRSGKRMYMDIGVDQGHGLQTTYAGRFGRIVVDELGGRMDINARQEQYRGLPSTRYAMPNLITVTEIPAADSLAPIQSVLEALINGENYPTGSDGRLAVASIVAAYVSNESGNRAIPVDNNLPYERKFPWA